jgi:predicted nucleic acid-binding protein
MIVIDSSVLVNALADDDVDGDAARARLRRDGRLSAPYVIDLEVMSALRRLDACGRLDPRRATLAMADLADLQIDRYDHVGLLGRIWQLRPNLTPYDAVYVALAEVLRCPLVTSDARLANGAVHGSSPAEIEVLTAPDVN